MLETKALRKDIDDCLIDNWNPDAYDILEVLGTHEDVLYSNWNTIRHDYCVNLARQRRKMIYADNKEAWLIGRVEFLEKALRVAVGEKMYNAHFGEID